MSHHKTNSLRLEYLINELRVYMVELRKHARATLERNPNSHLGKCLNSQAEMFSGFMGSVIRDMEKINWIEPEDPTQT